MAANTYAYALGEIQVLKEGETEETRNKRLNALLSEALSSMDEAMVAVTLENVGDDIEAVFLGMRGAFHGYTYQLSTNKTYAGEFTQVDLNKEQTKVMQSRDTLIAYMQGHLKEF